MKMKLSKAMEEGCKSTTKMKEEMFDTSGMKACALGAAYLGRFKRIGEREPIDVLKRVYRELGRIVEFPAYPSGPMRLELAIMKLNDSEEWERGEIAAWLEGLGL